MLFPIGRIFRLYPFGSSDRPIFGLFLYNKPPRWWRSVAAALTVGMICTVGLGALWLSMLWDKGARR
jgi:biotin transporter BioY